jgi:hypothetical protein
MNNSTQSFADALKAGFNDNDIPFPLPQDLPEGLQRGENGCPEYTLDGVGDARVAGFANINRTTPVSDIDNIIYKVLDQMSKILDKDQARAFARDLFVLLFEKRDCRGGEGERKLFYHFFWRLVKEYSNIIGSKEFISLIPEYGSWNDLFNLIDYIREYNKLFEPKPQVPAKEEGEADSVTNQYVTGRIGKRGRKFRKQKKNGNLDFNGDLDFMVPAVPAVKTLEIDTIEIRVITDIILDVIKDQWVKDLDTLEKMQNAKDEPQDEPEEEAPKKNKLSLSLLAKWLPREGGAFAKHNYQVFKKLLGNLSLRENDYRRHVSEMTEILDVAERHMCDGTWSEIDPKKTPSVCAFKNRLALFNMKSSDETRYPDNQDRIQCALNWRQATKEGKVKGGQLSPDKLVEALKGAATKDEIDLINAQWADLVRLTREKLEQARLDGFEPMDNNIAMIDLSPSMNKGNGEKTSPKNAAIGLGIMLSELSTGACRNMVITFDSDCHLLDFSDCSTLSEKVKKLEGLPVGYTTNFQLAMERICELIRKYNISEDEIPALTIFSDEQFDHSQFGFNQTMEDKMTRMFEKVGIEVSGTPYAKPRTVHWNLRSTSGFPAKSGSWNVQMVTGYSPSLFDLILCGIPEPTPYTTMRRKLDSARYQAVADAFDKRIGFLLRQGYEETWPHGLV